MLTNTVRLTLSYNNTDFTRVYQFEGVNSSFLDNVKTNALAFNSVMASIRSGADVSLDNAFMYGVLVSDDFDASDEEHYTGHPKEIIKAEVVTVEETAIPLF